MKDMKAVYRKKAGGVSVIPVKKFATFVFFFVVSCMSGTRR